MSESESKVPICQAAECKNRAPKDHPLCGLHRPGRAARVAQRKTKKGAGKTANAEGKRRGDPRYVPQTITLAEYERRAAAGQRLPGQIRKSPTQGSVVSSGFETDRRKH